MRVTERDPTGESETPRPIRGDAVADLARECGFPVVGITPAEPIGEDDEARLRAWLAAGKHGEMAYLADHVERRVDPRLAMPGARTMILVAEQYWRRNPTDTFPADPPGDEYLRRGAGRIAKYARGDDYHKRLKRRLFDFADALAAKYAAELDDANAAAGLADEPTRPRAGGSHPGVKAFVDTAPIMERQHAARAGIGWTAKNSLIIHQRRGSYLFLGGVLTTLRIDKPKNQRPVPDRCGTCTRCIDACPTDAITPYAVDATKCISYLTIEHRGLIDQTFHSRMGEWVFGCDVCQDVCPHNSARTGRAGMIAARPEYAPRDEPSPSDAGPAEPRADRVMHGSAFDLLEMLGWNEEDRRRATERSALKRAKLAMLRRNAVIAAGAAVERDPEHATTLRARLLQIADDDTEDELVRRTARQVTDRLQRTRP